MFIKQVAWLVGLLPVRVLIFIKVVGQSKIYEFFKLKYDRYEILYLMFSYFTYVLRAANTYS